MLLMLLSRGAHHVHRLLQQLLLLLLGREHGRCLLLLLLLHVLHVLLRLLQLLVLRVLCLLVVAQLLHQTLLVWGTVQGDLRRLLLLQSEIVERLLLLVLRYAVVLLHSVLLQHQLLLLQRELAVSANRLCRRRNHAVGVHRCLAAR